MKIQLLCLLVVAGLVSACGQRTDREPAAEAEAERVEKPAETEAPAVPAEQLIWVFEARGNRQCESGGTSLEESGAKLTDNGVSIQESRCGVRTDRMYPSACGSPTGDVLLHLIDKDTLDAALELGFDPVDQIEYQHNDCPSGDS